MDENSNISCRMLCNPFNSASNSGHEADVEDTASAKSAKAFTHEFRDPNTATKHTTSGWSGLGTRLEPTL